MHENGKEYTFLSSVPSLLVKNGSFYRLGFFQFFLLPFLPLKLKQIWPEQIKLAA